MSAVRTQSEYCLYCCHSGYCQVKWGIDCKRQGGSKTPRMKSMGLETESKTTLRIKTIVFETGIKTKLSKFENSKKQAVMVEPILTRTVNWG